MGIFGHDNVGKARDEGDIGALVHALGSRRRATSDAAAAALAELGPAAVQPLIDAVGSLGDKADAVLARIGAPALEPLERAITSGHTTLIPTLAALADGQTEGAFEALTRFSLCDPDPGVRQFASVHLEGVLLPGIFGENLQELVKVTCERPSAEARVETIVASIRSLLQYAFVLTYGLQMETNKVLGRGLQELRRSGHSDEAFASGFAQVLKARRVCERALAVAEGFLAAVGEFCTARGLRGDRAIALCTTGKLSSGKLGELIKGVRLNFTASDPSARERAEQSGVPVAPDPRAAYFMRELLAFRFPPPTCGRGWDAQAG